MNVISFPWWSSRCPDPSYAGPHRFVSESHYTGGRYQSAAPCFEQSSSRSKSGVASCGHCGLFGSSGGECWSLPPAACGTLSAAAPLPIDLPFLSHVLPLPSVPRFLPALLLPYRTPAPSLDSYVIRGVLFAELQFEQVLRVVHLSCQFLLGAFFVLLKFLYLFLSDFLYQVCCRSLILVHELVPLCAELFELRSLRILSGF